MESFVVVGTLVDSDQDWSLRIRENSFLVVDGKCGRIAFIGEDVGDSLREARERFSIPDECVVKLDAKEFLMPGLIDSHIHASQFPNAGLALDLPLLEWLEKYTFPTESQFSDLDFARRVYSRAVEATLASGTTAAAYYATVHREACEVLCDEAEERGQRALVGKVCMNRNSPAFYTESTASSLSETDLFVCSVLARKSCLVEPVVTPRFAVSCDRELMQGLADIARTRGVRIQSHLAESKPEVELVKVLEPWSSSYADVYASTGLLTPTTIMAHCVHLSDAELALLRQSGAAVAHCANSNCSIRSGNMDVRRTAAAGVKVGLGTDCSAGYSVSMIDSMRFAITVSNQLSLPDPSYQPLTFSDALYLATRGSAHATSLADVAGSLDVGLAFDALRIRMETVASAKTRLFGHESTRDVVHKFVFLGDDRNVAQVWVNGKVVKDIVS